MEPPLTIDLDGFWTWLLGHPNCILRAGTPEIVLYDHDDLHWLFFEEGPDTLLIQVVRGKHAVGELYIKREEVAFVQQAPSEREDEFVFDLMSPAEPEPFAAYFIVLVHDFGEDPAEASGRVH
jgi:hypothetical protein